ncbi:unnamed protein product [Rotaria sp. Silwood2]|nr:unnamed protein product [Rotaria sp. Silwood2]
MLTIKNRYSSLRQFSFELEHSSTEQTEQSTHTITIEPKTATKPEKIDELNDTVLLEKINKLQEENENMRLENLLFSRYLLRITKSKVVESFDDYEYDTDVVLGTLDQTKIIDTSRQISFKISTKYTKDGKPLWIKRSVTSVAPTDIRYLPSIEQNCFFIASYEVEQTHLDWQRMKANAVAMLYRNVKSDDDAQQSLNESVQRRIDKYRVTIGEEKFNSQYLSVPGELFVNRIRTFIDYRTSFIGALRVNTELLNSQIERVDIRIRQLDDFIATTNQVEIDWEIQMKNNRSQEFKAIEKTYIMEKSSYHKLLNHLEEFKKTLDEQLMKIPDIEKQSKILQNHLEQEIIDIDRITQENNKILKEKNILKDRINNTKKVPTINNYAHIIEQRKILQHDIDIWTQRVNIAESLLSQLQRQNKPPKILPPLQTITQTDQHL